MSVATPQRVGATPGQLRRIKPGELAIRFGFGAAIATVSALVSLLLGPRWGGLFLAFPAILPASLTLIERKESEAKAAADARGGQVGAIGMVAFAVVACVLLRSVHPVLALAAALLAWIGVSAGIFLALRGLFPASWGEDRP